MRIIESLRQERFDASKEFRVYAQGVARYTALQALSRHHHDPIEFGSADPVPSAAPGPELRVIRRQMVRRIFDQLSHPCYELVRLYFLEDQNYDEIAGRLSLPTGTIKSRLFRCLRAARKELHRDALKCARIASSE